MTKASNGFINSETATLKELLYIDALRGEDSTGVAALYNNGELELMKDATEASTFIPTKEFQTLSSRLLSRGKAAIGHNRKKTVGKISEQTAHPFLLDNRYAFMHNGTLSSHKHLADTEVDSEALGIHLTKCEGNAKAIEEALSTVYGAYACAWIDLEKEHLYLLRNLERPLYLAKTDQGYVFGSEYGFVIAACLRNRIKVDEIEPIKEHALYTFDLSKQGVTYTWEQLEVKKAMLPTHTKTTGRGKQENVGRGEGVSKNAYKRFRKALLGETISFWMDDYVERHYPTLDGDWLIFGKSNEVDESHIVRGYFDGCTEPALKEDHMERLHRGTVSQVDFDVKTKSLLISVTDIKLAFASNAGKQTWPWIPAHSNITQ